MVVIGKVLHTKHIQMELSVLVGLQAQEWLVLLTLIAYMLMHLL